MEMEVAGLHAELACPYLLLLLPCRHNLRQLPAIGACAALAATAGHWLQLLTKLGWWQVTGYLLRLYLRGNEVIVFCLDNEAELRC